MSAPIQLLPAYEVDRQPGELIEEVYTEGRYRRPSPTKSPAPLNGRRHDHIGGTRCTSTTVTRSARP